MNFSLIAFGTRGDVQPYVALAHGLCVAGHSVRICAGRNFGAWIEREGLEFAPIAVDIQEMMRSPGGVSWVEGSRLFTMQHMRRLFRPVAGVVAEGALAACEGADVIVSSFTGDWVGSTIAEKIGARYVSALLQPMRPSRSGLATLIPALPHRMSVLNLLMGRVAMTMLFNVFAEEVRGLRSRLGLPTIDAASFLRWMQETTTLFAFSEHVMPRPADYPEPWHLTGYWFHDEPDWMPDDALMEFLARGSAPVYVGFGSMTDSDARVTTATILRAQQAAGVRVVLYGGWAGIRPQDASADVHVLQRSAPHAWLFPRMAGVVHHGGAGTTGAAARAGVPQLVVPHFADQPYWGRRMYELGVGLRPVDKMRLNENMLATALRALVDDAVLRSNAQALGERVRMEDGVGRAVKILTEVQQ
ncbi:MAG: glycosyltransferase [Chloroflexi bacterium]|nr:glycosyltransferase [Chloroflexota bacterium]